MDNRLTDLLREYGLVVSKTQNTPKNVGKTPALCLSEVIEQLTVRPEQKALLDRIDRTLRWTLDGGNDPEDQGNVRDAIREIGEVLRDFVKGESA